MADRRTLNTVRWAVVAILLAAAAVLIGVMASRGHSPSPHFVISMLFALVIVGLGIWATLTRRKAGRMVAEQEARAAELAARKDYAGALRIWKELLLCVDEPRAEAMLLQVGEAERALGNPHVLHQLEDLRRLFKDYFEMTRRLRQLDARGRAMRQSLVDQIGSAVAALPEATEAPPRPTPAQSAPPPMHAPPPAPVAAESGGGVQLCPGCGTMVLPKLDGTCPACREVAFPRQQLPSQPPRPAPHPRPPRVEPAPAAHVGATAPGIRTPAHPTAARGQRLAKAVSRSFLAVLPLAVFLGIVAGAVHNTYIPNRRLYEDAVAFVSWFLLFPSFVLADSILSPHLLFSPVRAGSLPLAQGVAMFAVTGWNDPLLVCSIVAAIYAGGSFVVAAIALLARASRGSPGPQ